LQDVNSLATVKALFQSALQSEAVLALTSTSEGLLAAASHDSRKLMRDAALQDMDSFAKGKALFQSGLLSEAVLALEAEVQRQPQHVEAWRLLGTVHAENDDDQQVSHSKRVVHFKCITPDSETLHILRGMPWSSSCHWISPWAAWASHLLIKWESVDTARLAELALYQSLKKRQHDKRMSIVCSAGNCGSKQDDGGKTHTWIVVLLSLGASYIDELTTQTAKGRAERRGKDTDKHLCCMSAGDCGAEQGNGGRPQ
jgi:hypothetical protein